MYPFPPPSLVSPSHLGWTPSDKAGFFCSAGVLSVALFIYGSLRLRDLGEIVIFEPEQCPAKKEK
eukprot:1351115-Amorphochlora_amoeboformis.AAC.1